MMEFKPFLLYFLISSSALIQDATAETVVRDSGHTLQRVKRLDDGANVGQSLHRVKRLEVNEQKGLIRVRRSDEFNEEVTEIAEDTPRDDAANEDDEKLRKSVYIFGPGDVDETQVLKSALGEFDPNGEDGTDNAAAQAKSKRFDKHLMKIKQKWKAAMRKRAKHKYHLKRKMAKRLKHKEAKDFKQLKSARRRYQKQKKNKDL